jgi:hypothetical protein
MYLSAFKQSGFDTRPHCCTCVIDTVVDICSFLYSKVNILSHFAIYLMNACMYI